MRLEQSKNHSIQKYMETSSKYCILIGAIWSSLRREDCNFSKHGHMQSSSTTHCLQFALRKRYAWKRRRSIYHKVYLIPRLSRLKANSHSGQQDQQEQDARTSCDHPSGSKSSRGNLVQQRWLQNTWHTPFCSRTAGHKSQRQSQKVDSAVREPSE